MEPEMTFDNAAQRRFRDALANGAAAGAYRARHGGSTGAGHDFGRQPEEAYGH